MSSVHFYIATLGFAFGIFWQSFLNLPWSTMLWLMVVALALYLIARPIDKAFWLGYVIIFIISTVFGLWRFEIANERAFNPKYEATLNQEVTFTGIVAREPEEREQLTYLYVEVADELLLISTDRHQLFQYGDLIEFTGELQKPEPFATDLGRTFDYPNYLLARGVAYTVPFAKVTIQESNQGNKLLHQLFAAKNNFLAKLESQLVEPEVGLAEGLLLGVKRALGDELETVFRRTGIIHIVVLSGYNIMIVVAFVTYLLARLLNQRWQVIFGIIAIGIFAILVGLSATVVRASIMASLLLLVGLTGRTYIALRGLFLAGTLMLLFNPYLVAFDAGFQLSFLATLGLILGAPLLLSRLNFVRTFIGIREFLIATFATQVMVLPLLLYSIGEFSVVSVVVNILVLPMVPVSMLLTFLTGLIGLFSSSLALPLAFLAYLSLAYIITVATWFATLPFAAFAIPAFPFWLVPATYALIFYLIYLWYRQLAKDSSLTNKLLNNLKDWTIEEDAVELVVERTPKTPSLFQ